MINNASKTPKKLTCESHRSGHCFLWEVIVIGNIFDNFHNEGILSWSSDACNNVCKGEIKCSAHDFSNLGLTVSGLYAFPIFPLFFLRRVHPKVIFIYVYSLLIVILSWHVPFQSCVYQVCQKKISIVSCIIWF